MFKKAKGKPEDKQFQQKIKNGKNMAESNSVGMDNEIRLAQTEDDEFHMQVIIIKMLRSKQALPCADDLTLALSKTFKLPKDVLREKVSEIIDALPSTSGIPENRVPYTHLIPKRFQYIFENQKVDSKYLTGAGCTDNESSAYYEHSASDNASVAPKSVNDSTLAGVVKRSTETEVQKTLKRTKHIIQQGNEKQSGKKACSKSAYEMDIGTKHKLPKSTISKKKK